MKRDGQIGPVNPLFPLWVKFSGFWQSKIRKGFKQYVFWVEGLTYVFSRV